LIFAHKYYVLVQGVLLSPAVRTSTTDSAGLPAVHSHRKVSRPPHSSRV
jgi:hypothetical protein